MRETIAVRLTADICFVFTAALMLVLKAGQDLLPFGLAAALCLLANSFGARFTNPVPRILLSLLPGVSLFFVSGTAAFLVLGLSVLYTVVLMAAGRFSLPVWTYRRVYAVLAVPTVAMMVIAATLKTIRPGVLLFGGLFLILGLIALTEMRMGDAANGRWRLTNALMIVLPGLAAGTAAFLLYKLAESMPKIIEAVLTPIAALFYAIAALFAKVGEGMSEISEATETIPPSMTEEILETTVAVQETKAPYVPPPILRFEGDWRKLLLILGALFLVWLVYHIVKVHRRTAREEKDPIATGEVFKSEKTRTVRRRERGNAERVRRIYRNYLNGLTKQGLSIRRDQTSEEILESVRKAQKADEALRSAYVRARYGDRDAVTDRDVREAAKIYDEWKKNSG